MKLTRDDDVRFIQHVLRSQFYVFCRYYDPGFFTDDKPHLRTLADELQMVADGLNDKLMFSLPPRAGKSYAVSLWCAWMIGRGAGDPNTSIMRNSYASSLANKFSYDIRSMLQTRKFLDVFPMVQLKTDHASVEDWAVEGAAQSTYFGGGILSGITGKGCKTAAILDDPIKNLEDALSEVVVEKTWNEYLSSHKSRMESGCPEIQIATRWSRKDPIGMLLQSSEGKRWRQVVVPALAEDGRSFCEAVKTTGEYLEIKRLTDEYIWECVYQQSPIEARGLLFPMEELKKFSLAELNLEVDGAGQFTVRGPMADPGGPENWRRQFDAIIGYTDTADEGADYLSSLTVAMSGKKAFLLDVVHTQDPVEVTESLVAAQVIRNQHNKHVVESNAGGKSFARNVQRLIEEKSRCRITWEAATQNKETRILMASGQIKAYFYFRDDYQLGSDYDKFMRQLTGYVKMGKNQKDDAPDALTGAAERVLLPSSIGFLRN